MCEDTCFRWGVSVLRDNPNNPIDFVKGEASMTDYQFKAYVELRDKYDALLQEVNQIPQKDPSSADDGMSDYQFRRYERLRDKYEQMSHELAMLREENIKLQIQAEMLRALSNEKK